MRIFLIGTGFEAADRKLDEVAFDLVYGSIPATTGK
jgi:hypothetical protein